MPNNTNSPHFFLGANSPSGFYSFFDWLIDIDTAENVYILKGGPGCGKSSFMKRVASRLSQEGIPVEYILCSSDPDSLDGVIFPTLKTAVVDGTAPHVIEPKYPAVVERYINLGEFYDSGSLRSMRSDVIGATQSYKEAYPRVYRCISAARNISDDIFNAVISNEPLSKISRRTKGIIAREFRKSGGGTGRITKRFLSAISPNGLICRFDTAAGMCSRIYEINDNFGLSHFFLSRILTAATAAGYDVFACYCPLNPENKLEHILIPSLSLAFITSSDYHTFKYEPYRRILLDACVEPAILRRNRARVRYSKKITASLLNEAVTSLKHAKTLHDELESLYNPHVDFTSVYALADGLADELAAINS